ncbi:pantoate--beta-alanine ligase [Anaerorudis cellulosivorans]|uniref:pantoate--beta-alanine ligase n=1 Tax=Anaerorudis cellulosivorans TaxID=3397862 RepID=UPI002220534C|nr:pantoate--beta-alanine ligase [Seramator thermalis]MCW1734446.1 pantoate--beta-alanine ligase [Seramator thermalis]
MEIIKTVADLDRFLQPLRDKGKSIGLVPTMGALHQGHAALVKQCVGENEVAVVSVFVNPTQFNDKEDFRLYPRNSDADCALLESIGVTVAFVPSVEEMYPEPDTRVFDFGMLDKVMEGRFRPGHFNGVAQIVSKLFYAVKPTRAYFGEKDFQQLAIVREMVRQLAIPVEIVGVPIVRETSGLAMSSRNLRLSEEQRQEAAEIYRSLRLSTDFVNEKSIQETLDFVTNRINQIDGLRVEYFDIVDGNTLQAVSDWNDSAYVVGCIAVFCGDVRLIDNISYKKIENQ